MQFIVQSMSIYRVKWYMVQGYPLVLLHARSLFTGLRIESLCFVLLALTFHRFALIHSDHGGHCLRRLVPTSMLIPRVSSSK